MNISVDAKFAVDLDRAFRERDIEVVYVKRPPENNKLWRCALRTARAPHGRTITGDGFSPISAIINALEMWDLERGKPEV